MNTNDKNTSKSLLRRPIIVAAACLCIILAIVPAILTLKSSQDSVKVDSDVDELQTFSNYAELERKVKKIIDEYPANLVYTSGGTTDIAIAGDAETGKIADSQAGANANDQVGASANDQAGGNANSSDHSSTYTQVEGVDEADTVKTDGRFIYHVSGLENKVIITRADGKKTTRLSAVGDKGDSLIKDIYVDGDRLILVSDVNGEIPSTAVTVYDISNRSKPEKVGRYTQSGFLLSSRMTGGRVLLVTNLFMLGYTRELHVPTVSYGTEDPTRIPISDIRCIPNPTSPSYTVIGLIDPAEGKLSEKKTKTRAVLGGSDQIYCNMSELYVTATSLDNPGQDMPFAKDDASFEALREKTQILKMSFDEKRLKFDALGTVEGRVNNQFSMDASDGYFKIATTSHIGGKEANNLFVLDDKLDQVGALQNFARDEHIEAVRYLGKYAYVITYEEIDPLFIIDLSDPGDPQIKGHVKISGFSTLLVPVDKDHVLGFGFSTETTEFGESTEGLKLALFDVENPEDPKVSDSLSYEDVSSPIQYDHKALLVGPNGSYYAIPYDKYYEEWLDDAEDGGDSVGADAEDGGDSVGPDDESVGGADASDAGRKGNAKHDNGVLVFDPAGGEIKTIEDLGSDGTVDRCIYIGDWLYGICGDDSINAYKM